MANTCPCGKVFAVVTPTDTLWDLCPECYSKREAEEYRQLEASRHNVTATLARLESIIGDKDARDWLLYIIAASLKRHN